MPSRAASTRSTSRAGRESLPREGPDVMRMRSRTKDAERAPLPDSAAADERLATVLVSARRVEPYRIDAARDGDTTGTLAEKLIRARVITDDELARTVAQHYAADEVDFRHTEPEPE